MMCKVHTHSTHTGHIRPVWMEPPDRIELSYQRYKGCVMSHYTKEAVLGSISFPPFAKPVLTGNIVCLNEESNPSQTLTKGSCFHYTIKAILDSSTDYRRESSAPVIQECRVDVINLLWAEGIHRFSNDHCRVL